MLIAPPEHQQRGVAAGSAMAFNNSGLLIGPNHQGFAGAANGIAATNAGGIPALARFNPTAPAANFGFVGGGGGGAPLVPGEPNNNNVEPMQID